MSPSNTRNRVQLVEPLILTPIPPYFPESELSRTYSANPPSLPPSLPLPLPPYHPRRLVTARKHPPEHHKISTGSKTPHLPFLPPFLPPTQPATPPSLALPPSLPPPPPRHGPRTSLRASQNQHQLQRLSPRPLDRCTHHHPPPARSVFVFRGEGGREGGREGGMSALFSMWCFPPSLPLSLPPSLPPSLLTHAPRPHTP